jgi:phage-related protein
LFFNPDKTLKIRTNFDPFKYVSWIVGLFKGNGNTLVAFTKKLFVSTEVTINKILTYAKQHNFNIGAVIKQIRGVLSQLDSIIQPVKNYALQAVHFIPELIKNANIQENLMNVLKFVTSIVGMLMQYSTKVFNFVIENKAVLNNALAWVTKGAKLIGSNASSLTSGGTKLLSNVTPYISSGLGQGMKALGGGSKLLTAAGNQAMKGGALIMR